MNCNRVQPGEPQVGICNGVRNLGCPGNILKIYMGCPHPHKSELEDGTHGAGPLRVVLHSNSFADNFRNSHLTYLQLLTGFMDMLNSCGHALSQGEETGFHTGCNQEAAAPGYSTCVRAWSKRGPCNFGERRTMWL